MSTISGYLSNQYGFSETGNFVLDHLIKPKIKEAGIEINDPFAACSKELDFAKLNSLEKHEDVMLFWREFNHKVTLINNELMQKSDCMLAIFDGAHACDDGMASEAGYYAAIGRGPIFGLRSDIRLAENPDANINPQVLGYIIQSGGQLITGENAVERWAKTIHDWALSKKADLSTADAAID